MVHGDVFLARRKSGSHKSRDLKSGHVCKSEIYNTSNTALEVAIHQNNNKSSVILYTHFKIKLLYTF